MKKVVALLILATLMSGVSSALAENSVIVVSRGANPGATGVRIPILISNDVAISNMGFPLVIREITAGAYVNSLSVGFEDRLPLGAGQPLTDIVFRNQYADEDGVLCAPDHGFHGITYTDGGPNPVASSPEGLFIVRGSVSAAALDPGSDVTGSIVLTVNVTSTEGTFEIDTTCVDMSNRLLWVKAGSPVTGVNPSFTKGIITIATGQTPVAQCQDITVYTDGECLSAVTPDEVDAGSFHPDLKPFTLSLAPPGPYTRGVHSVLLIANDGVFLDSCSATITVLDTLPPVITCPNDIVVLNDPGQCGAVMQYNAPATDNCPGMSVSRTPVSGSFFPMGTTTVTCIATDFAGRADTCSLSVTVNDRPSAVFDLGTDTLYFAAMKRGPLPDAQQIAVSNIGRCGDIPYAVTESADWLAVSPAAGTTESSFDVQIEDTDLFPGDHWATIFVNETSSEKGGAALAQDSVVVKLSIATPPASSVVVGSRSALSGATGVHIPIHIANEIPLQGIEIPLVIREITSGAYITDLTVAYADRLPDAAGAPLSGSITTSTYPTDDGSCQTSSGTGFGTIQALDYASPDAVLLSRSRSVGDPPLYPGSDVTGSIDLIVDVTSTVGTFEIDTTCADPGSHIAFFEDGTGTASLPAFTKGIITIVDACDCPSQGDYEPDGFLTALDLAVCIDILFAGRTDLKDPNCPTTIFDLDCDGFSTALDLGQLIDHLFAGGIGPCDPCAP